jgi:PAS domain S-box-containing protein
MAKILIVDDEADVRQFLSRSLATCGYAVREACDGGSALECLATEHPDVVITDLHMPVMDGFELALRIRANPEHAATKVIFFTGRASPLQIQAMAETAGVSQIVTKPATIDEVQEAVDAALQITPEAPAQPADRKTSEAPRQTVSASSKTDDRFRTFFSRSLDAILLLSTDARCLDANPAAIESLAYARQDLLNLTLWTFAPLSAVESWRELWSQFLAAGCMRTKLQVLLGDGSHRVMELSAVANIEPGIHLVLWRNHDPAES